jgi:hypothetical protein
MRNTTKTTILTYGLLAAAGAISFLLPQTVSIPTVSAIFD